MYLLNKGVSKQMIRLKSIIVVLLLILATRVFMGQKNEGSNLTNIKIDVINKQALEKLEFDLGEVRIVDKTMLKTLEVLPQWEVYTNKDPKVRIEALQAELDELSALLPTFCEQVKNNLQDVYLVYASKEEQYYRAIEYNNKNMDEDRTSFIYMPPPTSSLDKIILRTSIYFQELSKLYSQYFNGSYYPQSIEILVPIEQFKIATQEMPQHDSMWPKFLKQKDIDLNKLIFIGDNRSTTNFFIYLNDDATTVDDLALLVIDYAKDETEYELEFLPFWETLDYMFTIMHFDDYGW